MTTTHTPGPWTVGDEDSPLLLSGDGAYVAQVISRDETGALRPGYAADAALIAAAPDLLAALEAIFGIALDGKSHFHSAELIRVMGKERFDAARAAIAKATGTGAA